MRGESAVHPDDFGRGLCIRFKTLNTKTVKRAELPEEVLPVCLAHNLRDGNEEHRNRAAIDPQRKPLNSVLRGRPDLASAADLVRNTLDELGAQPRRVDAIMGIELVVQPPDGHDTPEFWGVVLAWADENFEHVVSAVVHRDERRPHGHLLALAVAGGKLDGNAMTSGVNRFKSRIAGLERRLRDCLGLRMKRKPKTLEALALSTGKGAKTHAQAAYRDAQLERRAAASRRAQGHQARSQVNAPEVREGVRCKSAGGGSMKRGAIFEAGSVR